MLMVVPPLVILSAISATVLSMTFTGSAVGEQPASRGSHLKRRLSSIVFRPTSFVFLIALFLLSYFMLAPGPTTASTIEGNDAHWRAVQSALRGEDPSSTVLVMNIAWDGPFREASYLLPQYRSYAIDTNEDGDLRWLYSAYGGRSDYSLPTPQGEDHIQLPPNTRQVIVLDPITAQRLAHTGTLDCVTLSDGSTLYILTMDSSQAIASLQIECSQVEAQPSGASAH
jgi:hypothetical protein